MRIGGTDFDRQLNLGVVMPLFGFGSPMKLAGLAPRSRYFHDLASWSNINRIYEPRVMADVRPGARPPSPCCSIGWCAWSIDAVFPTVGSVRLAHVRKAITKVMPAARIDGDTFDAVGKGLTIGALRRYGPTG